MSENSFSSDLDRAWERSARILYVILFLSILLWNTIASDLISYSREKKSK